jgi:hypothetical protein
MKILLLMIVLLMGAYGCTKKRAVPPPSQVLADKAEPAMARKLLEAAVNNGYVRIIVTFKVSFDPTNVTPANIADVQKEVKAHQDEIIRAHFGNAETPKEGRGFPRSVTRYDINPGFMVNVNPAELESIANNSLVEKITPDGVLP